MPHRVILTGAPGAGKTTLLSALRDRGHAVIAEAATDVIAEQQALGVAEPWTAPGFLDRILARQLQRQAFCAAPVQLLDRSPVCTLALAVYSGLSPSPALLEAARSDAYERQVLFVRPLGFITPTAARRISYADSLRFERIHEEVYRELGYTPVDVPAAPVEARVALVEAWLSPELG